MSNYSPRNTLINEMMMGEQFMKQFYLSIQEGKQKLSSMDKTTWNIAYGMGQLYEKLRKAIKYDQGIAQAMDDLGKKFAQSLYPTDSGRAFVLASFAEMRDVCKYASIHGNLDGYDSLAQFEEQYEKELDFCGFAGLSSFAGTGFSALQRDPREYVNEIAPYLNVDSGENGFGFAITLGVVIVGALVVTALGGMATYAYVATTNYKQDLESQEQANEMTLASARSSYDSVKSIVSQTSVCKSEALTLLSNGKISKSEAGKLISNCETSAKTALTTVNDINKDANSNITGALETEEKIKAIEKETGTVWSNLSSSVKWIVGGGILAGIGFLVAKKNKWL